MRDLVKNPLWKEESLGQPLPDSKHACAVSLPTWDSVIGYEEGRDRVVKKMELGYPRFFLHPFVKRLFAKATLEVACLLYTSPSPRDKRQSRMPSSA